MQMKMKTIYVYDHHLSNPVCRVYVCRHVAGESVQNPNKRNNCPVLDKFLLILLLFTISKLLTKFMLAGQLCGGKHSDSGCML